MIAELCTAAVIASTRIPHTKAPLPTYIIEEEYAMPSVKHDGKWYYFSQEDIDLMARVVMSEASTQSDLCKEAVATTILNRYFSPDFYNDISQIIADAYSTADNGAPTDECYLAVHSAMKWYGHYCQVVPWCCYYFRGGHYHEWAQDYCQIDDLYFSIPKDAVIN